MGMFWKCKDLGTLPTLYDALFGYAVSFLYYLVSEMDRKGFFSLDTKQILNKKNCRFFVVN